MSNKREKAEALFKQGYNCAQSVFLSFSDELGLDEQTAAKLSSPFGGGMGRMREVCGAVSGMFMVLGMLYGYDDPNATTEKAELYARVQKLAGEFKAQNGTIICRELLDGIESSHESVPSERTEQYYKKRPCALLVGDAAEILEKYIQQQ